MSVPEVTCTGCSRKVSCVRVSDGTVYRPFAWKYPDPARQLDGVCSECQARQASEAFLEKATAMHLADPSRPAKSILDELLTVDIPGVTSPPSKGGGE